MITISVIIAVLIILFVHGKIQRRRHNKATDAMIQELNAKSKLVNEALARRDFKEADRITESMKNVYLKYL